ncbi:hypothetical protein J3F80_001588 [Coemansia sp. RSA 2526]|nr:hypothetical protein LPJ54_000664 [Coemansia sp. RSA 1824]KAJ2409085.1 hypothetical protein J3F80_001588 [Coemansia sp. RSA 2526]
MTVGMDQADRHGHQPKGHSMQSASPRGRREKGAVPKISKGDFAPKDTENSPAVVSIESFEYTPAYFARWKVSASDLMLLLVISMAAVVVRCYKLSNPANVVFDEVHFGKFAGKYLNSTYFFDLHPPLAKMMFAAVGRLAGYDGVFDFKSIGLDYIAANVPYVAMRLMPALLGAATVPATYATVRACGYAMDTAALAALLVCVENGLVTQSRLILLDSPLVFFTVLTLLCWSMFWTVQDRPFSRVWWAWLLATGLTMGCAASCKWVAFFLIPTIGLSTLHDLWDKIADQSLSPARWSMHFGARAIALICMPVAVYIGWFYVHFAVLSTTGGDAAALSPEFQVTLDGAKQMVTDRDVYYGSEIRMRSTNARSGFLHSHLHPWQHDKGSGQQQVTIYSYADANNVWVVEPAYNRTVDTSQGLVPVRNGDVLRLRHKTTGRFLHSHDKRPAMSNDKNKFELSGYGFANFSGDSNDNFRVDILEGDPDIQGSATELQSIYSRFRLVHTNLHCMVFNSRKKLPKWAFEQIEVNCMRNCLPRMSTWHVEHAFHPNTTAGAPVRKASYRPLGMLGKIWEYNKLMADSNQNLIGDHPFAARPQHWPWLRRGTAYWGGPGRLIYQLGNPLIWWGSLAALAVFATVRMVLFLLDKRRIRLQLGGQRNQYISGAGFFALAWTCHYVPFFLMGRELFTHHYFPALWMAIIVMAFTVDLVTCRLPRLLRSAVYVAVAAAVLHAFHTFSYITYARTWTKDACLRAKWLPTWDLDCEHAIGGLKGTVPPVAEPVLVDSKPENGVDQAVPKAADQVSNDPKYVQPEFINLPLDNGSGNKMIQPQLVQALPADNDDQAHNEL